MALYAKELTDCALTLTPLSTDRYQVTFTDGNLERVIYTIPVTYNNGTLTFHHEDVSTTRLVDSQLVADGRIEAGGQAGRIRKEIERMRGIYRGTINRPRNGEVQVIVKLKNGAANLAENALVTIESSPPGLVPQDASIFTTENGQWHYRFVGVQAGEPYDIEIMMPVSQFDS